MIHKRETHRNLSDYPIKYNKEGKRICQICDKVLKPRCIKYCSYECSHEMLIRNSHQALKWDVYFKRGQKCEQCGVCASQSGLILDHKIPIAIGGGEFDRNNVWLLCKGCNKIKTRQDHKDIAIQRKVDRLKSVGQTQLEGM